MLTGIGRSPRSSLVRVETPADSVVLARVLLCRDLTVDLVHGFNDHSNVIRFRHGGEGRSDGSGVTGKHGSRSGTVDVVSGVADRSDTWQVGGTATTEDGLVNVLPESSLVKKLRRQGQRAEREESVVLLTETLQA
jgi:hypothetical protein